MTGQQVASRPVSYPEILNLLNRQTRTLQALLAQARRSDGDHRTKTLTDMHNLVRGMGIALNDALGERSESTERPNTAGLPMNGDG